jgi:putative nucleotidyltransferase with HDIG domain
MVKRNQKAVDLLHEARSKERAACMPEAVQAYEAAITTAERSGERAIVAEAQRRLAVVFHHRNESHRARELCNRSYQVACEIGSDVLAAEALNTMGGLALRTGEMEEARSFFVRALERGGATARGLEARVEQNLGILANIRGQLVEAVRHYERAVAAYRAINDEHGSATAYVNLGIAHTDLRQYDWADSYFSKSSDIAERAGDVHLQGMCLANHAEAHFFRGRYCEARRMSEAALAIFDQLDSRADKSEAYKMMAWRNRAPGAGVAAATIRRLSAPVCPERSEAVREALLGDDGSQPGRADLEPGAPLTRRSTPHRSVCRQGPESRLRTSTREWGQSIESADSYTFGHCERVAQSALAVARQLQLDDTALTTIRLGAYLHDLGKVRVPHEILNKPGPLTGEEFEVVQMHPIWGMEMLAAVEFPWDLKPIIRWHHERYDGSGYPDRLRGEEIPIAAQIVGIVDVYDALTTQRSYRSALSHDAAMSEIEQSRGSWSQLVYSAFVSSLNPVTKPLTVRRVA